LVVVPVGVTVPLEPVVAVIVYVLIANEAETDLLAMTLVSVLGLEVEASLQEVK